MPGVKRSSAREPMAKRARTTGKGSKGASVALYRSPRANPLGGPWPVQKQATLTYSTLLSITVTTGNGIYFMSTNGLYDPDISGTGAQPLYFDQLMELYNHYTVTDSSAEFQVLTSNEPIVMALHVDDDTSATGDTFVSGARPGAKILNVSGTDAVQAPVMRMNWNAAAMFGPGVLNNALFRGNSAANPDEQMYYVVHVYDPTLTSYTLLVRCKMSFRATFTELKTIASS